MQGCGDAYYAEDYYATIISDTPTEAYPIAYGPYCPQYGIKLPTYTSKCYNYGNSAYQVTADDIEVYNKNGVKIYDYDVDKGYITFRKNYCGEYSIKVRKAV